jgi:hypothetical protein
MLREEENMTLGFTQKGKYVLALMKAVEKVESIPVGGKLEIPGYESVVYLGPSSIEGEVQFHGFQLPDGSLLEMESEKLTDAITISQHLLSTLPMQS